VTQNNLVKAVLAFIFGLGCALAGWGWLERDSARVVLERRRR
jgi:hypothetical protein